MTGVLSLAGVLLLFAWLPLTAGSGVHIPLPPILLMIFAPVVASALQLALARTREYGADIAAAELTGDPRGLALALDKLERLQGGWMERLFVARLPQWLRTHPDISERIRRLLALEASGLPLELPDEAGDRSFARPVFLRPARWHGRW